MNDKTKIVLFLLRIALGLFFLYSGVSKILDPEWTSAGYLKGAQTFTALYQWFGSSQNIGWVDFLNKWGQALVGLGLVFGASTRYAAYGGILLMILYYFPVLHFPYVGEHSLLIDEHVIYILVFCLLIVTNAGNYWGIETVLEKNFKQNKKVNNEKNRLQKG